MAKLPSLIDPAAEVAVAPKAPAPAPAPVQQAKGPLTEQQVIDLASQLSDKLTRLIINEPPGVAMMALISCTLLVAKNTDPPVSLAIVQQLTAQLAQFAEVA